MIDFGAALLSWAFIKSIDYFITEHTVYPNQVKKRQQLGNLSSKYDLPAEGGYSFVSGKNHMNYRRPVVGTMMDGGGTFGNPYYPTSGGTFGNPYYPTSGGTFGDPAYPFASSPLAAQGNNMNPALAPQMFNGQQIVYPYTAGMMNGQGGCDPNILACLFSGRRGPRRQHLGITSTAIPAGTSATIVLTPNTQFTPQELRIPSDIINSGLLITAISVGGRTQLAGGSIPARLFSEVSQDAFLDCDSVSPSQGISITFSNTSGAAVTVTGALIGTAFIA